MYCALRVGVQHVHIAGLVALCRERIDTACALAHMSEHAGLAHVNRAQPQLAVVLVRHTVRCSRSHNVWNV
jgi:hypothetical protein